MAVPHKSKRDIEKLGVFREDGYLREIDYIPPDNFTWNASAHKDKQMLGGTVSAKRKDGTNNGYFSGFLRTFAGEGHTDALKEYRKERLKKSIFNYAGQFLPSSPGKKWSGAGDYQGTFSGHIEAFSPLQKDKIQMVTWKKTKKTFRFKQHMKGGYGTVDITINHFPDATEPDSLSRPKLNEPISVDTHFWDYYAKAPTFINRNPYYSHRTQLAAVPEVKKKRKPFSSSVRKEFRPSGPGPVLGGCKAGCFTHFSTFAVTGRTNKLPRAARLRTRGPFIPSVPNSVGIFRSIIQKNVDKKVTCKSYNSVEGVMYKKEKSY